MTVRFEVAEHVATITIARPDVMNAIDLATEGQLQRIWSELEQRRDVRVIVLTGDGERAFCVGADMKNPSGSPTLKGVDYWAAARPGGFGGIALRETLNIPVIARVNGYALGGGFEMVLGCDIVVACDDASFSLPERWLAHAARRRHDAAATSDSTPHRDGHAATGQRIGAKRAAEIGLVNEVVPRAELDAAVTRWVDQILACAPLSVQAINRWCAPPARCRPRRRRRCDCQRWWLHCSPKTTTKGCEPSRSSASRSGRGAELNTAHAP
jgi:crotonobetainyl-CoA hydratase